MTSPEQRDGRGGDGGVRELLRAPLSAVLFLTRIPCPSWVGGDPVHLARSTVYFPLVGALVGALGALVYAFALRGWNPIVAGILAVVTTVWVTGAFHEDALADACDGFGGGWEPAQVLTIMKDSRIGSYGSVGLMLVLLARVSALAMLGGSGTMVAVQALVVGHTLGRWSSLPLIRFLPYVSAEGARNRPFAASVTDARLVVGTLLSAAVTVFALHGSGLVAILVVCTCALVVTMIAGRYFWRRLRGMTGDCLGAANQLVELSVYLVLASTWMRG